MATAETPKFEYYLKDWWPEIKPFPDLIPIVGMVTVMNRSRAEKGLSVRDMFQVLARERRKHPFSVGTETWPKPVDSMAHLRAMGMAVRNGAFLGYQGASPILVALGLRALGAI